VTGTITPSASLGQNVGSASLPFFNIFANEFTAAAGNDFTLSSNTTAKNINFKLGVGGGGTIVGRFHLTTGNLTLQNGGTFTDAGFRLDVNGTARIQNQLTTTGSITAASAIARGVYMNQTMVAAANGDTLIGLDIAPTFTTGAFTGTKIYDIALRNASFIGVVQTGQYAFYLATSETAINSPNFISFQSGTSTRARLFNTGNLVIQNGGTFTDAGFRLDVVGADSRFNGIRAGLGAGQVATNTVFGNSALGSNVSGTGLTAIGFEALKVATGNNNTGIGYRAGLAISTGANNTVFGYNIATALTTGSFNTLLGDGIVVSTDGSSNCALGSQLTSTGFSNTIMGAFSSTGGFSSSVILGRQATATASNQFVVGSSAHNSGAATTEVNASTQVWNVIINGTARKILLFSFTTGASHVES
jgi:hypothetical protein